MTYTVEDVQQCFENLGYDVQLSARKRYLITLPNGEPSTCARAFYENGVYASNTSDKVWFFVRPKGWDGKPHFIHVATADLKRKSLSLFLPRVMPITTWLVNRYNTIIWKLGLPWEVKVVDGQLMVSQFVIQLRGGIFASTPLYDGLTLGANEGGVYVQRPEPVYSRQFITMKLARYQEYRKQFCNRVYDLLVRGEAYDPTRVCPPGLTGVNVLHHAPFDVFVNNVLNDTLHHSEEHFPLEVLEVAYNVARAWGIADFWLLKAVLQNLEHHDGYKLFTPWDMSDAIRAKDVLRRALILVIDRGVAQHLYERQD